MEINDIRIEYEAANLRAAAYDGEKRVGTCSYREDGGKWILDHTVVLPSHGGRGIARSLVLTIVAQAREQGKKIVPVCSYAVKVLSDSQFQDVVA